MIPKQIDKQFRVLGLDATATFSEVKEARQWYTKAFHPDRFPKNSKDAIKAEEKQKEINLAFEYLKKWFENGKAINHSQKGQPYESDHRTHAGWSDELSEYFQYLEKSEKAETTLRNTFCDLQLFADWLFAHGMTSDLRTVGSEKTILRYARALSESYRPATVARHLYSIRGWLVFAKVDAHFIISLAAQYKSQLRPQTKSLTEKQLAKFLETITIQADLDEQTLIQFLAHTGVTAGEVCQLRWKDISFIAMPGSQKKCPTMKVSGRSGDRNIPLNELAVRALTKRGLNDVLRKGGRALQNFVFSKNGSTLTPKMVHYTIDRCGSIAGMNVTPSILRNTFAKKLANARVPRPHLAELLGITEESAKVYYPAPKVGVNDLIAAAGKG